MADLLDIIFGPGSNPIRREAKLRITSDADGNEVLEPVEGHAITHSPEGSIDNVVVARDQFYHCGCSKTELIGGQCGEPGCRRVSCHRCFGRCSACQMPLCLEHSKFLQAERGNAIRLCGRCAGAAQRRLATRKVAKTLLSPFVEIDKREG